MEEVKLPWRGWKTDLFLGSGEFGRVYKISREDSHLSEESMAVKIIRVPNNDDEIRWLVQDLFDEKSVREHYGDTVEKLLDVSHKIMLCNWNGHILKYDGYDAIRHDDGIGWDVFIRMELLPNIRKKLETASFNETQIIKLGKDLCSALITYEEQGLLHGNIKPSNIFFNEYGDYKLSDASINRIMMKIQYLGHPGTCKFYAPEKYYNQEYSSAGDIYSLGLVMYLLLNNKRFPFEPINRIPAIEESEYALMRRLRGTETFPNPVNGGKSLIDIVRKACAHNASERYKNGKEMLEALMTL